MANTGTFTFLVEKRKAGNCFFASMSTETKNTVVINIITIVNIKANDTVDLDEKVVGTCDEIRDSNPLYKK